MNARYWQRGETLDYTAEEAVANGQVVSLGNRIGVAGNDIAEGATGALHVTGVYIMDKKASEKITMGLSLIHIWWTAGSCSSSDTRGAAWCRSSSK